MSSNGKYIYHLGIIDYLQDYNLDKKGENFAKQHMLQKGKGISAVEPKRYVQRFYDFM